MVGNIPDAQDVYQEALLAAFQGLPRFRMDSVFSTWLYRIAVNKAMMELSPQERVLSYLYGGLTPAEETAFRTELESNADLARCLADQ